MSRLFAAVLLAASGALDKALLAAMAAEVASDSVCEDHAASSAGSAMVQVKRIVASKVAMGEMQQLSNESDVTAAEPVDPTNVIPISPFGKEDTARELQDHAARTQDTLVDAVENAEVAEIKRAVFRSLTRLRAAQIKEFDTIARLETQAIDEYNDNHHYRVENPLEYLSNAEPGVGEDKYTSFHD
eukprot:CAMPEP_0178448530 /NCGR_PEP_ID=MMETSP0689_2-20121128/42039_1 /TAXON_ID=160604 /ORGANISM="Amphidinium massartii, Strain CS-259" /LENGTH=185 /DNA_ID=CAMNT_0020073733 /DNA_START=120 /DNA_END=677 /DNA_ORIENTATION=+